MEILNSCNSTSNMCLRQFEYIMGDDSTVLIDIWLDFGDIIITRFFPGTFFVGSHGFPCQSLLLSTSVLNDK